MTDWCVACRDERNLLEGLGRIWKRRMRKGDCVTLIEPSGMAEEEQRTFHMRKGWKQTWLGG